jgi:hypothetical protein
MKTRNTTITLIAVAIATIWTFAGASTAEAVIAIIRQTGAVTLAQGQAISAHVVNIGEERGLIAHFRVIDSAGSVHAESDRLRVELGQTGSYTWVAEERMAIRVELMVEGPSSSKPGIIASLELYNTSGGKTTVFLPYLE